MKYILDSGMGTELEAREINIPDWKKSIWTANALIFNPDIVLINISSLKQDKSSTEPPPLAMMIKSTFNLVRLLIASIISSGAVFPCTLQ